MTPTQNDRHKAILTSFLKEVWSDGAVEKCGAYLAETYTIHHDPGDPWEGCCLDLEGFKSRLLRSRAPFHFVGHSMGAIVVRSELARTRPRKLGRVVLLAPPNRGARLADLALRLFGRRLVAATELCSHPDSYVDRLAPAADLDCGVIAASWDHAVSLASTHLPGQRDHVVLRGLHTLPLHRHTPAQVGHFLRGGCFLRETD